MCANVRVWFVALGLFVGPFLAAPVEAAESRGPQGYAVEQVNGTFEDIYLDLESAILAKGLVVDYVGHVNAMLERTAETVGSVTADGSKDPYREARYLQFCSAKLTHEVLSANPLNMAICPYVVFIFELNGEPGVVHVGYRRPIGDPSRVSQRAIAKVDVLLAEIVAEAVGE